MLRTSSCIAAALAALLAAPAFADDDDDRGKRRHGGHHEREEKFWDGPCKVERKWEKNGGFKEVRDCKGGGGPMAFNEREEKFSDGSCKVERKWGKDGDFKEERKCKGGGRPVMVTAAPAVVYPPWIVVQQGAPVYAPQSAPAVPASGVFRCQSQTVGQVLGGIVGGVLGNQIGSGTGRAVATVGGAVAGVLVGGEIGRRVDAGDQGCVGQVLEFAPAGQRVQWTGDAGPYAVVPGKPMQSQGRYCRPYTFEQQTPQGWKRVTETACRRGDGVWLARS